MLRSEQEQTAVSIETQHHDNDIETCLAKAFPTLPTLGYAQLLDSLGGPRPEDHVNV